MGIRLVSDRGDIYWFTIRNWKRCLRFAGLHGWKWDRRLLPDRWGDDVPFVINKGEVATIGGAYVDAEAAASLADAIKIGAKKDPPPPFLFKELERMKSEMRQKLPAYDPANHSTDLVAEWLKFADFAETGGFRVDLIQS